MEYLIRPCRISDLQGLINLIRNHAHYEEATCKDVGMENRLKSALFSPTAKLNALVVEVNCLVVGYTTYTIDYSTWDAQEYLHLDCLYLEPEYRGVGIGKTIMEKLLTIAREHQCCNLQWQTPDWNEGAVNFYRRIGSKPLKKVRFYRDV